MQNDIIYRDEKTKSMCAHELSHLRAQQCVVKMQQKTKTSKYNTLSFSSWNNPGILELEYNNNK